MAVIKKTMEGRKDNNQSVDDAGQHGEHCLLLSGHLTAVTLLKMHGYPSLLLPFLSVNHHFHDC